MISQQSQNIVDSLFHFNYSNRLFQNKQPYFIPNKSKSIYYHVWSKSTYSGYSGTRYEVFNVEFDPNLSYGLSAHLQQGNTSLTIVPTELTSNINSWTLHVNIEYVDTQQNLVSYKELIHTHEITKGTWDKRFEFVKSHLDKFALNLFNEFMANGYQYNETRLFKNIASYIKSMNKDIDDFGMGRLNHILTAYAHLANIDLPETIHIHTTPLNRDELPKFYNLNEDEKELVKKAIELHTEFSKDKNNFNFDGKYKKSVLFAKFKELV